MSGFHLGGGKGALEFGKKYVDHKPSVSVYVHVHNTYTLYLSTLHCYKNVCIHVNVFYKLMCSQVSMEAHGEQVREWTYSQNEQM